MGRAAWIVTGVVVLAAGAAAAWLFEGGAAAIVASPPNSEIAPASLVVWVQADDLRAHTGRLDATDAWKDLQGSKLVARFRETETGKAWTDLLTSIEKQAAYPIDRNRAMHFLGRQVSLGIEAPPETGDPAWLVLTKLDVDALVKELLKGEGDWTKLRDELDRRTAAMNFRVEKADHRGRTITSATRGAVAFHSAILGDTLAVSDSAALLRTSIDVLDAKGEGSLARAPRFRDEVSRLRPGFAEFDWIDLEGLRVAKPRLLRWLGARDATGAASAAADRLLEGTTSVPAIARATDLPAGDLYQMGWSYSRTAAELAGAAPGGNLSAALADAPLTLELSDPARVARAWKGSALRARLADGPVGRKLREWFDDPAATLAQARSKIPAFGGPGKVDEHGDEYFEKSGDDPDADPDAATAGAPPSRAAGLADALLDPFTTKMAAHLAWESFTQGVTGDVSMAVDFAGGVESAEFVLAMRLGAEGYLASLLAEGAATRPQGGVERWSHGGSAAFTADAGERPLVWTHVGDAIVLSTSRPYLERALASASVAPPADAAGSDPGWSLRVRWKRSAWDTLIQSSPVSREDAERLAANMPGDGEVAVYVDDAFRSIEVRSRAELRKDPPYATPAPEPRSWSSTPEDVVVTAGGSIDFVAAYGWIREQFPAEALEGFDDGVREAERDLEVSIADELLPALGPEVSFAVVRTDPPSGASEDGDPAPFVPDVILSVEVRDEALVERTIDAMARTVERSQAKRARGGRAATRVVRAQADGRTIVRFEDPASEGQPGRIVPTFVLGKGKLLFAIDGTVVRRAVDADEGRAPSFAKGALRGRIGPAIPAGPQGWAVLDWNRLVDQVAAFAPHLARAFPPDELPDGRKRPEFPAQPDEQSWDRYERETKAFDDAARDAREPEVRKWLDAARCVDFAAWSYRTANRVESGSFVVRFAP